MKEYEPKEKEIFIIQDSDGNWRGKMIKFGKLVEVREASPNDVLVKLMTHDGNVQT